MTKKNTTSRKNGRFLRKVHQITEMDIFTSIAIASILMNVLFLAAIFVLTSTDTFDRRFYGAVQSRYCENISGVKERAEDLGSEADAIREWQINCGTGDFKPFFDEAIEKFNAQSVE